MNLVRATWGRARLGPAVSLNLVRVLQMSGPRKRAAGWQDILPVTDGCRPVRQTYGCAVGDIWVETAGQGLISLAGGRVTEGGPGWCHSAATARLALASDARTAGAPQGGPLEGSTAVPRHRRCQLRGVRAVFLASMPRPLAPRRGTCRCMPSTSWPAVRRRPGECCLGSCCSPPATGERLARSERHQHGAGAVSHDTAALTGRRSTWE